MRFCRKCGMKVKDGALTCPRCLFVLNTPEPEPTVHPPYVPKPGRSREKREEPAREPAPFELWFDRVSGKLFPWFWPSAFEAAEVKDNPVLKLVKDAGIDERTERRRRRNCQIILVLNLVLLVLGLVALFVWQLPSDLSGISSLMVLFLIPLLLVIFSLTRMDSRHVDLVGLATEACQVKPADVLWALMEKSRMPNESPDDPEGERLVHLGSNLLFSLILIVVCTLQIGFAKDHLIWLFLATMYPLMAYSRVTFSFVEFGRFSPRLLIIPLLLLATVIILDILVVLSRQFVIGAALAIFVVGLVYIWLINWLCERIPYWEIERRLKLEAKQGGGSTN